MTIKTQDPLFPTRREVLKNFDYKDFLRGQAYVTFYGGLARSEEITIQEEYDTGDDEGTSADASAWIAQTFQVSQDTWVNRIDFYCKRVGTPSQADIWVTRVDGSNKPDRDNLIFYAELESLDTTDAWHKAPATIDNQNFVKLEANTTYAIVIDPNNQAGADDNIFRVDGSSPSYANGNILTSSDSGSTWTADTSKDLLFRIYGVTTNPYILFTERFDSEYASYNEIPLTTPITTDSFFKRASVDYDAEVGISCILKGQALLNLTISADDGSNNGEYYVIAKLKKVSGGTETTIATGQGKTDDRMEATLFRNSILLNITTQTSFKKGDIVRLTLEIWLMADGVMTTLLFYQDPTSRNIYNIVSSYSGDRSDLVLQLPFKLEE